MNLVNHDPWDLELYRDLFHDLDLESNLDLDLKSNPDLDLESNLDLHLFLDLDCRQKCDRTYI